MDRGYAWVCTHGITRQNTEPEPEATLPGARWEKKKKWSCSLIKLVTYDAAGRATPQQDLGMGEIA